MTPEEKEQFVKDFIDNVRSSIIDDLKKVPAEWTGIHLRNWVGDRFQNNRHKMSRTEKSDFENDILVHNL